jgi:hypothetical protein
MNDKTSHLGFIVTILAFWIFTLFSPIFEKDTHSAEAAQGIVPRSAVFRAVNYATLPPAFASVQPGLPLLCKDLHPAESSVSPFHASIPIV